MTADPTPPAGLRGPLGHPHFVCIGMDAGAARWFQTQVGSHPDVWMPPIADLRFFAGDWTNVQREALDRLDTHLAEAWLGADQDLRDGEFLRQVCFVLGDDEIGQTSAYRRLFALAGGSASGDVAPEYAGLDEAAVETLVRTLRRTRFVCLTRGPVRLAWEAVNRRVAAGEVDRAVLDDPLRLATHFEENGIEELDRQRRTVAIWSALAPRRFATFRVDKVRSEPDGLRRRVFSHLGLDGDLCSVPATLGAPESSELASPSMLVRDVIVRTIRS